MSSIIYKIPLSPSQVMIILYLLFDYNSKKTTQILHQTIIATATETDYLLIMKQQTLHVVWNYCHDQYIYGSYFFTVSLGAFSDLRFSLPTAWEAEILEALCKRSESESDTDSVIVAYKRTLSASARLAMNPCSTEGCAFARSKPL